MIRAFFTILTACLMTATLGSVMVISALIYPARCVGRTCTFAWGRAILATSGVRLSVRGQPHVSTDSAQFFAGNHQSALDIPVLLTALRGNVRFLAKESLFRIPIFGRAMRAYGYIPIDRSNARKTLATIKQNLQRSGSAPISLAVFPEGTRCRDGRLGPFRRGSIKIAKLSGLPVVPFTIDGSLRVHRRNVFKITPGQITLTFHPPIQAAEVAQHSAAEISDRVVAAVASGFENNAPPPHDARSCDDALACSAEGL